MKRERSWQRLGEDERREQILRATVTTVAHEGYDGASLARIAATAGVSKGLISHYFADKDSLMTETVRVTLTATREEIAARLDLSAPVPDVIRAALRHAAALGTTHRDELTALHRILANMPDRFSLADYEENYRAQETLFTRGQAEGTLRAFDVRVMAVTYQGAIDTMLGYAEAHPDTDLPRYADALADILLAGITDR